MSGGFVAERSYDSTPAAVDAHIPLDSPPGDSPHSGVVTQALALLEAALDVLAGATLPPASQTALAQASAAALDLRRGLGLLPPPAAATPAGPADHILVVGSLRLDTTMQRLTLADRPVKLTPTEFRIVHQLALTPGRTVTREQLLTQVWGPAYIEATDYLWVHLSRLRHKLRLPDQPPLIVTERGLGYRLRITRR